MDDKFAARFIEDNIITKVLSTQDRVSLLEKLSASIAAQLRDKYPLEARLTLETGVYMSTTDQLAKTILYLTKYNGDQLSFYDGVSSWSSIALGADISIKSTDAQTGATTNGNKIISGLTDTSQLVVGMLITGTNVGAGSVIATIDSGTQVTGTVNSTGSASNTITFKLPASTVYDVFCKNNSGVAKLKLVAGQATRTTQNGVIVMTGYTTYRLVGSTLTTATAGQLEISASFISVSNLYNKLAKNVAKCPGYVNNNASDVYGAASATWIEANGDGRINFVLCDDQSIEIRGIAGGNAGASGWFMMGIGIDTLTAPTVEAISAPGPAFSSVIADQTNFGLPLAKGSHYYSLLLCYLTVGGPTIYADFGGVKGGSGGADPMDTYMAGQILF